MLPIRVMSLFKTPHKRMTRRSEKWDEAKQQTRKLMTFVKSIQASGIGLTTGAVDIVNEFCMNVDTFDYEELTFDLICAERSKAMVRSLAHELIELENSSIKIAYKIDQPGSYMLDIKYKGMQIPCAPFKLEIRKNNANARDVVVSGNGLEYCMAGTLSRFHLDLRKSGYGKLSIMPASSTHTGDIDVIYFVTEMKTGYEIQYVASTSGSFFFHVKLNGKHISGSPFFITVYATGINKKAKLFFRSPRSIQKEKYLCNA